MQSVPTASPEYTASVEAETRFRAEMVKLVEHQANSGKSIVLSTEKFAAIVDVLKHPDESVRKYNSQFRSWVRYRGFKLLDFPELGQKDVLVRPACLDSKLIKGDGPEYLTVLQAPDLYDAVKHVHNKVFQHGGYKRVLDYMQRHYYGVTRGYVQQFVAACPVCRTLRPNSASNFRPGPKSAPTPPADPDTKPPCLEIDIAVPQELDFAGPLQVIDMAAAEELDVDTQEIDLTPHHQHGHDDDGSSPSLPGNDDGSGDVFTGVVAAASNRSGEMAGGSESLAVGDDVATTSDPAALGGSPGHRDDDAANSGGAEGGNSQTSGSFANSGSGLITRSSRGGSPEKRVSRTIVDGEHVYVVTVNEDSDEADSSAVPPDHLLNSNDKKQHCREARTSKRTSEDPSRSTAPVVVVKQEPPDEVTGFPSSALRLRTLLSPSVNVKRADLGSGVPNNDAPMSGDHDLRSPRRSGGGHGDTEIRLGRKRPAEQSGLLGDRGGVARVAKVSVMEDKERGLLAQRDNLWRNTSATGGSSSRTVSMETPAAAGRQFPPSAPRVFISVGSAKKSACTTTTSTTTTTTSLAVEPYRCDVTPRSSSPNEDTTTNDSSNCFFSVIHLDIIDMRHAPDSGNNFIAHVTDPTRKLHVLFPLPDSSASTVAPALDQRVLALYGMPGTLCSNRGRLYVEDVLAALARLVEGGVTIANGETAPAPGCSSGGGGGGGRWGKAGREAQRTNVVEELINLLRLERGPDPRTGGVPWLSWLPRIMRSLNRDWHADLRANSAPLTS